MSVGELLFQGTFLGGEEKYRKNYKAELLSVLGRECDWLACLLVCLYVYYKAEVLFSIFYVPGPLLGVINTG